MKIFEISIPQEKRKNKGGVSAVFTVNHEWT